MGLRAIGVTFNWSNDTLLTDRNDGYYKTTDNTPQINIDYSKNVFSISRIYDDNKFQITGSPFGSTTASLAGSASNTAINSTGYVSAAANIDAEHVNETLEVDDIVYLSFAFNGSIAGTDVSSLGYTLQAKTIRARVYEAHPDPPLNFPSDPGVTLVRQQYYRLEMLSTDGTALPVGDISTEPFTATTADFRLSEHDLGWRDSGTVIAVSKKIGDYNPRNADESMMFRLQASDTDLMVDPREIKFRQIVATEEEDPDKVAFSFRVAMHGAQLPDIPFYDSDEAPSTQNVHSYGAFNNLKTGNIFVIQDSDQGYLYFRAVSDAVLVQTFPCAHFDAVFIGSTHKTIHTKEEFTAAFVDDDRPLGLLFEAPGFVATVYCHTTPGGVSSPDSENSVNYHTAIIDAEKTIDSSDGPVPLYSPKGFHEPPAEIVIPYDGWYDIEIAWRTQTIGSGRFQVGNELYDSTNVDSFPDYLNFIYEVGLSSKVPTTANERLPERQLSRVFHRSLPKTILDRAVADDTPEFRLSGVAKMRAYLLGGITYELVTASTCLNSPRGNIQKGGIQFLDLTITHRAKDR